MKHSTLVDRLHLDSLAEQRRLANAALHRRIAALEEKLIRRDARIAQLQGALRTARARLRRIAAIATGRQRRQVGPVLRERAVGEDR